MFPRKNKPKSTDKNRLTNAKFLFLSDQYKKEMPYDIYYLIPVIIFIIFIIGILLI